jgi:hypothetical protein
MIQGKGIFFAFSVFFFSSLFEGNYEPATTVWELWESDSGNPDMDSRNHIMFGTVGSWFYKGILGFDFSAGIMRMRMLIFWLVLVLLGKVCFYVLFSLLCRIE